MPAAADDDDVVFSLRFRLTPDRLPAFVAGQTLLEDAKGGIMHGAAPVVNTTSIDRVAMLDFSKKDIH